MTVITNAELVLKDSHGNIGTVRSVTDNDFTKIRNAIADIGKLVDPVSHLPIKATATTVGVVQLADNEAIAAGTTGRVVDAKQLQDAVMGVTPANCVTNVAAGSTANKIKVTKDDYTTTITIDNVEHADSANSVQWGNVQDKPSSFTPSSHTHDDRYYTESEIDTKLSGKANATDLSNYLPLSGGNVTGNLTVQNKNVVRSVNGVNADASGNVKQYQVPDFDSAIDVKSSFNPTVSFTAPSNGFLSLNITFFTQANHYTLYCNNVIIMDVGIWTTDIGSAVPYVIELAKGDTLTVAQYYNTNINVANFIPYKTVTE